jgi:hypothetical protein
MTTRCKYCNEKVAGVEHRYEQVQFPYNPEWSVTRLDAGVFCSASCLARYLAAGEETIAARLGASSAIPVASPAEGLAVYRQRQTEQRGDAARVEENPQ